MRVCYMCFVCICYDACKWCMDARCRWSVLVASYNIFVGENKFMTIVGDGIYEPSILFRMSLLGIPAFYFEDTPLGIFDFCSGIEKFQENWSFIALLGEFSSYIPCLGIKEMDHIMRCCLTEFSIWMPTCMGRIRLNDIWSSFRFCSNSLG